MAKKKKLDLKDVAVRSVKTFFQAFVVVLAATDEPLSEQAIFAAAIAGVSAAWNTVLVPSWNWFKSTI